MRVKGLSCFRSKLLKPCRKILPIFKFRLKKKPVYIRAPKTPRCQRRKPLSGLLNGLFSSQKKLARPESIDDDQHRGNNKSMMMVFPSPLLGPSAVVDDSCRSFENYLVEMIVEEGKLRDLTDIEELLFCWKNLKCPVFLDMVGRFYGDLCRDLFSSESK